VLHIHYLFSSVILLHCRFSFLIKISVSSYPVGIKAHVCLCIQRFWSNTSTVTFSEPNLRQYLFSDPPPPSGLFLAVLFLSFSYFSFMLSFFSLFQILSGSWYQEWLSNKSYFYLPRNHLSFLTSTKYFNKIATLKLKLGEHRKTKHFLCECVLNCNLFLWSNLNFQHHYCSLQCHIIFRKHSNILFKKHFWLLSMLKTVVLTNIFV